MTREDFVARLLGAASMGDLLYNLREGLNQMDLKDRHGTPLTPDFELADFRLKPTIPEAPPFRVKITLQKMTFYSQGVEMAFPTKVICHLLDGLEDLHVAYHSSLEALIKEALRDLSTEQERILADLLRNNPPSRN